MTVEQAKALAYQAHAGRKDRLGYDEIDHIRRVAENVHGIGQVIAWLHDTVEDGLLSWADLEALDEDQRQALVLLTRIEGDGRTYMQYIRDIAAAAGLPGTWARQSKHSDLHDNCTRHAPDTMMALRATGGRYDRARQLIEKSMVERGETVPVY